MQRSFNTQLHQEMTQPVGGRLEITPHTLMHIALTTDSPTQRTAALKLAHAKLRRTDRMIKGLI